MATPNYQYEKRQKDLAKKKKAEEKRLRKASKPADGSTDDLVEDQDAPIAVPPVIHNPGHDA